MDPVKHHGIINEDGSITCKFCNMTFATKLSFSPHITHRHKEDIIRIHGNRNKSEIPCTRCGKLVMRDYYDDELEYLKQHTFCCKRCERIGTTYSSETKQRIKDTLNSPETNKKLSDAQKRVWQNPEHVEKMHDIMVNTYIEHPEYREKCSQSQKIRFTKPEEIEKLSKITKGFWENDEYREKVTEATRKSWEDPEVRQARIEGLAKAMVTQEYHDNMSKSSKEKWQRLGYNEKVSTAISKVRSTPESYVKWRLSIEKYWKNCPIAINVKRSKGEIEVFEFLESNFKVQEWVHSYRHNIILEENRRSVYTVMDMYSNLINTIVCYDGILHFINNFRERIILKKMGFIDRKTIPYCQRNNIKLIRISKTYYLKNKQEAIQLVLKALCSDKQFHFLGDDYNNFEDLNKSELQSIMMPKVTQ